MSEQGLSNHHHTTLNEIFDHQNHSVEWRKIESLLEAVGTVTQEHNGHLKVQVGPETETFHVPKEKDAGRQLIVDLRRMLTEAGLDPSGGKEAVDERVRDYGDSRWGKPTDEA